VRPKSDESQRAGNMPLKSVGQAAHIMIGPPPGLHQAATPMYAGTICRSVEAGSGKSGSDDILLACSRGQILSSASGSETMPSEHENVSAAAPSSPASMHNFCDASPMACGPDCSPRRLGLCSSAPQTTGGKATPTNASARRRCDRCLTCKFVFTGIDLDRDAEFELVPRLIGRGGQHMRAISDACGGKVRIRGRGSGHREEQKRGRPPAEADVPLQIALSCKDKNGFEEGKKLLARFLKGIGSHFERFCKGRGIEPPASLFSMVIEP